MSSCMRKEEKEEKLIKRDEDEREERREEGKDGSEYIPDFRPIPQTDTACCLLWQLPYRLE